VVTGEQQLMLVLIPEPNGENAVEMLHAGFFPFDVSV